MKKILVTGAGGYIGKHVVKCLLDMGHKVIAADLALKGVDERAIFSQVPIFSGDPDIYAKFGKPDICIHLAWRDGFVHNSPLHMSELSNHVVFCQNMIAGGLPILSVMGTMHEIGYWEGAIDETTPCKPLSQYGVAKNALRQSLTLFAQKSECRFRWLRAYYITGDDIRGSSIFSKIVQAAMDGKKEFPFTSGKNMYDFIDVDELAEMIAVASMQTEIDGIINLSTGKPITLAERVERFIADHGFDLKLKYGAYPDRPYDSPGVWGDATLIRRIMDKYHKQQAYAGAQAKSKKEQTMKVFVTGVCGQLGHDVMNELIQRNCLAIGSDIHAEYSGIMDGTSVTAAPYISLDITNEKAVLQTLREVKPDAVIHCAAWTAVDDAEDVENIEKVNAINALGTRYIAEACKEIGSKMMYISTDYVFNGLGDTPWFPDCKEYAPLSVYGKTKLMGELAVQELVDKFFVVRIAWAFGLNGKNFIKTMLRLGEKYDSLRVVSDQIGTPTYTFDLARLLVDMIETNKYGYYHATNEGGYISWADFAEEIFRLTGMKTKVVRVTTEEYGESKAKRPINSRLDKSKLVENGFKPLPTWQDALKRFLDDCLAVK